MSLLYHGCDRVGSLGSYFSRLRGRNFATSTERQLKKNLSLPVICNTFDATATDTLTPHFPVYTVLRKRRPRPESMQCVLLLWAAFVCDGACLTLDDAAGLPPTEVSASPPPRLAAISSAVGTHCRASPKPWSTFSWNNPTHNPWVSVNASTSAWLPTPTTNCARQSCLGCAQQHSVEQREQLFIVDVSG